MKTTEEYVKADGVYCPVCGSGNLECGPVQIDNEGAYQPVVCNNCFSSWVDTYKLSGYTEMDECTPPLEEDDTDHRKYDQPIYA